MDNNNGSISNYEKWRAFTDGLTSPDSFIDFGFYFLISACLQRRVWTPPSHKPIYANQFITLVAPPGIGKGLVITEIIKLLKYHKLHDPYANKTTITGDKKTGGIEDIDRQVLETCAQADYLAGKADESRNESLDDRQRKYRKKTEAIDPPLLIPMSADATSYEALVGAIARSLRRKQYSEFNPTTGRNDIKIATHSSICTCLEEMSSMFRKKCEDVVSFLTVAWDCGDYKKDTKTQGVDRIQRCCANLIAGTTPEHMQRTFKDDLLNEGYASRSIFLYEPKDRKIAVFIPELSPTQLQYQTDLLDHIKKLTELYGQVEWDKDAIEYIEDWWKKAQLERPNLNEKLNYYYARKKIHVIKLTMALHFSESIEMKIHKYECEKAVKLLNVVETRMHHALISNAKNPYFKLGIKILTFLKEDGRRTLTELKAKFWEELPTNNPSEALSQTIEHYIVTGKLTTATESGRIYYDIMREEKKTFIPEQQPTPTES